MGQREADDLTWTLYAVSLPDLEIDRALTEASGLALIVLLQSGSAEHGALCEAVFVPVADALAPIALPAVEVAGSFMTALKVGDYATAYDLSAPSLQEEFGSVEALEAWMEDVGVEPVDWIFLSRSVSDEETQLLGTATFVGDQRVSLEVVLFEIDGEWRVDGFHLE